MKKKRNRTQTLDHSTVMRTIEASTNPELKMLWENFADISFVRDYRRKKKQPRKRRAETDEECIEEMFSHVDLRANNRIMVAIMSECFLFCSLRLLSGQIVFLKEFISSTLDIRAFRAILSQTEITVMTESEKKLAFVSFCIEEYKTLHGMDGRSVADLFEKYGVTDYLLEHYAILHSFSREAILNDIDHFMNVRRNEA